MKATTWLGPILTLLYATRPACTAQRGGSDGSGGSVGSSSTMDYGYGYVYPLDYLDANLLQDDYMVAKRNKPSLSIVNPLDVLRQRLLLEIARRQMKENTRQVELNRAILKNVGKRTSSLSYNLSRHYRTAVADQKSKPPAEHQQQLYREQLLLQQKQPHHYRYYYYPTSLQLQQQQQQQFDRMTPTSIFDFLQQRPQNVFSVEAALKNADDKKKSLSAGHGGGGGGYDVGLGVSGVPNKQLQVNGNEIGNETNHRNNNNNNNMDNMDEGTSVARMNSGSNNVDDDGRSGIIFVDNERNSDDLTDDVGGENIAGHINDNMNNNDDVDGDDNSNNDNTSINNANYRSMNYLYRLHKNRFARK